MEFVYVVPREKLFPDCTPHGLALFGEGLREEDFVATVLEHGFFVERRYAEHSPHLKQVIPYVVVCSRGQVLLLRRLAAGGEARLHDKLSIGVGGHINPVDAEGGAEHLLAAATRREIHEELRLEAEFLATPVGILNDDSNPVGAVHVGLVQVVQTDAEVEVREEDQLTGELSSPAALRARLADGANFETWSSRLVEKLDQIIPQPTATLS